MLQKHISRLTGGKIFLENQCLVSLIIHLSTFWSYMLALYLPTLIFALGYETKGMCSTVILNLSIRPIAV